MFQEFLNKIRRRETPFYDTTYRGLDYIRHFNIPTVRPIFLMLYNERQLRRTFFRLLLTKLYYEPMFRAKCAHVGKRLFLDNSGQVIPEIGGPLRINIGDNVRIVDRTTFSGLKLLDNPTLDIGDGSSISHGVIILVAKHVSIGKNCTIGAKLITDNPGHSIKFRENRVKEYFCEDDVKPVIIHDDAWLAADSMIMKGVEIGRGAVVGSGAVVTESIPPFSIAVGNPAKIVKSFEH